MLRVAHSVVEFFRSRPRLLIALATLAAYSSALSGPFQFDDEGVIVRARAVQSLGAWWLNLGHGLRPLLNLSYALDFALGGSPLVFHLTNLAIHLANSDSFLRLYVAAARGESRAPFGGSAPGALFAGLLFALHPIQTEAVTYVSGRSASLETLFVLLTLLIYAEGVRSGRAALTLLLAPLAFLCAVLVKETAAALPPLLVAWDLLILRARLRAALLRQSLWVALLTGLFALAVLQARYFSLLYAALGSRSLVSALAHQVDAVAYLCARLVLVERLCIDPGLGLAEPSLRAVLLEAIAILCSLALALRQWRERPLIAFGALAAAYLLFFPYLFVQRSDVLNERHFYLASIGLCMASGGVAQILAARVALRPILPFVAGGLSVFFGIETARRNLDYRSEVALWESSVARAPSNPRAHNNLGVAYERAGRLAPAHREYAHALLLEPRFGIARSNLARTQAALLRRP